MDKNKIKDLKYGSKIVRAGQMPCPNTGAHSTPIYQTSTFVFENVDQGAARFAGEQEGYIYTRLSNPTQSALEEKMALLENGEKSIAFGSGMAAITAVIFAIVKQNDHIIADKAIYGCTYAFLDELITKYGVEVTFINTANLDEVKGAIKDNTKLIYFETPANPTLKIVDIKGIVEIAKKNNIKTVIDNTFMSPYFQRPLEYGVDVVVHSATKYLNGHGDVIAGIAVGSGSFMDEVRMTTMKDIGGIISPFNAWLLLRGLKTLAVRMEKHNENAIKVAEYLENHPAVSKVHYPGLPSHPQYELVKNQMYGFGGMISFELKDGYNAGKKMMDKVELCHLAVSLGDVDTLIQHPASMTHSVVPKDERIKADITDGLIRLSVGLEDPEDIIKDLDNSMA